MSKLTYHVQMLGMPVDAVIAASKAEYVKIIDPPEQNPFPGKQVIGRTYLPDGDSNHLVSLGAEGALIWFETFLPTYRRCTYVQAWEAPNEPQPVSDPVFRKALVAFTLRLTELMHSIGKKLVALNLSVGCPDILEFMDFKPLAGKLDAIGLHEYSAPTMQNGEGWYCLRYRKYKAVWATDGFSWPPTFITECGIDGGVLDPPRPRTGWKSYATRDAYMAQLKWYDAELQKDPEVLAATIFTSGPNGDWLDFDFDVDLSRRLATHIAGTSGPEVPPMATDPRAANCRTHHLDANGKVDGIHLVWEPVPSSMYACISAQLIPEAAAQNNTVVNVEAFDVNGVRAAERLMMEWPYGEPPDPESPSGPGNPKNEFTAASVFPTTKDGVTDRVGPLGFFVADAQGNPISDHIWGYGLPDARHVCGYVAFKQRSTVTPPVEPPVEPPGYYTTLEQAIKGEAAKNDVLRINPNAMLCKVGTSEFLWPTSNEYVWSFAGVSYTGQRFRDPYSNAVVVLYCVTGAWDNVMREDW
jgi:hypothetical protein